MAKVSTQPLNVSFIWLIELCLFIGLFFLLVFVVVIPVVAVFVVVIVDDWSPSCIAFDSVNAVST